MNLVNENKHKLGAPKRIIILRALQLGDLLCSVPAFKTLRAAFPNTLVTLAGLSWSRSFVERFSEYLDEFIEFPGFPGFPEKEAQIEQIPSFLLEVQTRKYDLALQMQGSGAISNPLVMLFGTEKSAGFYLPGHYCPDPERFLSYPVHELEVVRHLRLMEFLGLPSQGEHLEFPLCTQDWEEFHELQAKYDLPSNEYGVIHPGARSLDRRWPVEWFANVGDGLVERGLKVVLTGVAEEAHLTEAVASQMKSPAINLAGQTSLGGIGALLSASRLLVSNDTGVSHIADALDIPSVVLFTASDPARWAPQNSTLHRVVAWATTAMPQTVLDEVDQLLFKETVSDIQIFTNNIEHPV